MKLIERVEIIGNYKSKIEKVTSRTYSDRIALPRQGGTDVELSGGGGKAGNDKTSARGRGFRASRRSEVAFMKGTGLVGEAAGLPFIISRPDPGTSLIYGEGKN